MENTQGNYSPNLVKIGTGKQTLERTQASRGKKKKRKKGRINFPNEVEINRVLGLYPRKELSKFY